ncbi:MAG: DUF6136 family protein [Pseudomonadota bacterium]|nr:DUF6136 family protein [Pseudomonadota bacterium]
MNYWQFRRQLYQQALKQWLESLTQVSTGIVALFPMALYALLLLPLLALGVLADKDSHGESFFYTLWGYLLLAYCWIAMQKEALAAADYTLYDRSLPVPVWQRGATELGLLLYAANVFVIGPAAVLLAMVYGHFAELISGELWVSIMQLYPVSGLLVLTLYYCQNAMGRVKPWLSLGLLPLVAMPWAASMHSPWLCLLGLAIAILIERTVCLPAPSLAGLPLGFWRLFLQQDINHTKPTLLRAVVVLLVLVIGATFVRQIDVSAKAPASLFLAFVLGVVAATKLLELQSLRRDYQYYLNALPISHRDSTVQALGYCLVYCLPGVLLIVIFNLLSLSQWGLFLLTYAATQVGILLRPGYYLIFPLMAALIYLGVGYLV